MIYSGYITKKRVALLYPLLKEAGDRGLLMRAIVPPPRPGRKAADSEQNVRQAISKLKECGFVVDMSANIHEKAVIVDDSMLLNGSLNVLSSVEDRSETMIRSISAELCLDFWKKNSPFLPSSIKEVTNFAAKRILPALNVAERRFTIKAEKPDGLNA